MAGTASMHSPDIGQSAYVRRSAARSLETGRDRSDWCDASETYPRPPTILMIMRLNRALPRSRFPREERQ